ncbi:MAG TPA: efflux RND transporter periplasmic adaptor subunit [Bradyrhizobium sp.]|uniref:efflux RND transporter periplasmic adaptor subunit n=1 Tax=Bradyrhizobium sp. TaxID=376 RepID=UPI002CDCA9A8|nr:efflux RND transporter periplasmic adaptor subunit [Bradyrhizobium sp.]HLZ03508.1 efflux RND transporter periplasmic adaptor subunit [Bradyrhizobium sp.]
MLVDSHSKTASPDDPGAAAHAGGKRARTPTSRAMGLTWLVAVLLVGIALYGFRGGPAGRPEAPTKAVPLVRSGDAIAVPEASPVRGKLVIAPVVARDVPRDLTLPAVVEADPAHLVKVAPPLAGRVTQLKVTLGEQVKAGQPLFVIDSPDLAAAYSDYDKAKALLALALKNRDRQRGLLKFGGAAEKDAQQAEADYVSAEAEDQRATAHLKQIGVDPEAANKSRMVTVVAPMEGSITDLGVAPGEYWNDSTQALMTIADLSSVWVTANVPEKDIALISKGQAVDVELVAYPGKVLHGTVLFVSDVLDTDTRRIKVRIAFDNPDGRLRPGMFATATFRAATQKLAIVPTSALVLKDDATQVFVETAPWQFEPRTVDIKFQQGEQAFIASGVKAGDRIVVKGGVLLGD